MLPIIFLRMVYFAVSFLKGLGVSSYGKGSSLIPKDSLLAKDFNITKIRNKSRYKVISRTKSWKDSVQLKNIIKDREGNLPYTCKANIEIKKRVHPDLKQNILEPTKLSSEI